MNKYHLRYKDGTAIEVSGPSRVRVLGLIQMAPQLRDMLERINVQIAKHGSFTPTPGMKQELTSLLDQAQKSVDASESGE